LVAAGSETFVLPKVLNRAAFFTSGILTGDCSAILYPTAATFDSFPSFETFVSIIR
jgi:hypothetical protein